MTSLAQLGLHLQGCSWDSGSLLSYIIAGVPPSRQEPNPKGQRTARLAVISSYQVPSR